MKGKKIPGPALIALGILAWAIILWLFTLGNPGFVPAARFIFIVLVIPLAAAEWLKMKGIVKKPLLLPVRLLLIAAAAVFWYVNNIK
ncbi:hypothetical protein DCCM_3152 [Desulfocucumis palustris]|uniref:Uncharacterized protein n=1 Tax=Desulfocucumis palustris TaxID=1898651 RepID=A0A2L2XJD0_9FIRM|nr:hypothetical protein [Desulfocucumis palustris]GBF34041.1 hypothetical protein DCCM_3152 [Desulfocucumis palustris]